ncbi:glycoside hydrolase superfamily [Gorgonomyces haynaldii]|nr:glycoside hydrolase superfamily [Gorgonomyces haynaldii]
MCQNPIAVKIFLMFFWSLVACLQIPDPDDPITTNPPEVYSRANWIDKVPLSVQGNNIVDKFGIPVRLQCVQWAGAHMRGFVVSGLDRNSMANISQLIAQKFNCVRLSYSTEMITRNQTIDPIYLTKEPSLLGKTPLEAYQMVVKSLTEHNVMVVLDNHVSVAAFCCSEKDHNGLWFNDVGYTEEMWFQQWEFMASLFKENPLVVMADLRNEVRGSAIDKKLDAVYWDDERKQMQESIFPFLRLLGYQPKNHNWRQAAQTATERILQVNPNLLVSVGGIYDLPTLNPLVYTATILYLKALNLNDTRAHNFADSVPDVKKYGISPSNRVVYSCHDYHFLHLSLDKKAYQKEARERFFHVLDTAPLFLGEFNGDITAPRDKQWWDLIVPMINRRTNLHFSLWTIDGTQSPDRPGHKFGDEESYGLLDPSWHFYKNNQTLDLGLN